MTHNSTFNLTSPATTIPAPSHQGTASARTDGPVDARPSEALAVGRGLPTSGRPGDTTVTALRKAERRLSAVVLIAAPLAGLVGALLTQDYGGGMSKELAFISAHDTRWLVANCMTLLMGALMAMAIAIVIALVRGRAPVLGYTGGALAIFGIYFHGAVVGYSLVEGPLTRSDLPKSAVLTFAEHGMYEHMAFTAILTPFFGFFLGMILLGLAIWRARIAPVWVAALISTAPLTEFLGVRVVSPELMFVLFAIGFGYIALRRLRGGGESQTPRTAVEAHQAVATTDA